MGPLGQGGGAGATADVTEQGVMVQGQRTSNERSAPVVLGRTGCLEQARHSAGIHVSVGCYAAVCN